MGIVTSEQARSLSNGRLAAYLKSGDPAVVLRAELAVGRTKQPAGIALLRPFLGASQAPQRAMAVYGVGLIGGAAAGEPVIAALRDPDAEVEAAALDATDRLAFGGALPPGQSRGAVLAVTTLLEDSRSPVIRARAATTLAAFAKTPQSGRARAALVRAFGRERDAFARWHDMWALYRGSYRELPLALLRRALRDPDEVVRIEAVRAVRARGNRAELALVRPLTRDPSWRVQEQALEAVSFLEGREHAEPSVAAIPAGIHLPPLTADPYANAPALRLARITSHAPAAGAIIERPQLYPRTLAQFTGPMPGPHPLVRIATTKGNIEVELFPEWAPLTVENFLNLARAGYYDGNPWFRIVPDFVAQSGDPSATAPGPGYTIPAEENPIEQDSYVISMGLDYTNPPNAHAKRDSAGSEFYITYSPQLHLDRDFTVFGRVRAGIAVLARLTTRDRIVRVQRLGDIST